MGGRRGWSTDFPSDDRLTSISYFMPRLVKREGEIKVVLFFFPSATFKATESRGQNNTHKEAGGEEEKGGRKWVGGRGGSLLPS